MRSRRNTAILAALIALLLVFGAFRSGEPTGGASDPYQLSSPTAATPENTLMVHAPDEMFGCIRLCSPSGWFWSANQSGVLVDVQSGQGGEQSPSAISWNVVGEFNGRWHSLSGGSSSGVAPSPDSSLISFVSMSVPQSSITFRYGVRPGYVMTLGRPLSSRVWSLELRYDTGEVVRRRFVVSNTGETAPFGVITQARAVCALLLFDANGAVLQELDPGNDPRLVPQVQHAAPGTCQP